MPAAWTRRDERQYEAVKDQQLERGRDAGDAAELAARVVNKRRREEGRTPNRRTQGTGNPNQPLDDRTVDELRNLARELKIPGRSKMTRKADLIKAIRDRRD